MLSQSAYDYFAGGADDEITLRENALAWQRIRLLPHILRDVSNVDTSASVLGVAMDLPVLVAPMAAQRLAHDEGEIAMAVGAADSGAVMVVSTMATVSMEEVAAASPRSPKWFQFYVQKDRRLSEELVRRADAAGYSAVVLTVDLPVLSRRRRDEVNRFELPEDLAFENIEAVARSVHGSALAEFTDSAFDPGLTFSDIAWIQSLTDMPVVVKGVVRPDDAIQCVDAGAAAVIVSNHGGRQLDGCISTAEALPAIAAAIGGRVPVLVDGGIRGGYDVLKAICLGASAVLVGRPFLWGLAVGGSAGVKGVFDELTEEFARSMALCGATSVEDLSEDLIA